MGKILISVGPIHGKIDSVKIITNKFKGGLASMMAKKLAMKRPDDSITVVKCPQTDFYKKDEPNINNIKVIDVDDFYEYEKFVLNNEFDAYILAGAVANLIPENPLVGKFPSHKYKEGDKINISFIIAPRVIAHVKEKFPRSTLIGYKLFDGTREELIEAGWQLLVEAKANAIFCNSPSTAKEKKICLLPDGSKMDLSFDEHVDFISRLLDLKWYRTEIISEKKPELDNSEALFNLLSKITEQFYPYSFGCVAYKARSGFYTTTRGKKELKEEFAYIRKIDHVKKIVYADRKASLNAPLLDLIFELTNAKVIVHSHKYLDSPDINYVFSGTTEEDALKEEISKLHKKSINSFNVKYHGYYAWFNSLEEAEAFVNNDFSKTKDIDWNDYNNIFPERYLKESEFDSVVKQEIKELNVKLKRKISLLEIGSNKLIRYHDKNLINSYYVFDKYVMVDNPEVIQIDEKDIPSTKVDLVVLRGTINYLNKDEISRLREIIMKNKCILLFNTFKNPSVINRNYTSKTSQGTESTYYDTNKKQITHILLPSGSDNAIKHSFFYYSLDDFKALLTPLNLDIRESNNSLYIKGIRDARSSERNN
jgi:hypothetical protein